MRRRDPRSPEEGRVARRVAGLLKRVSLRRAGRPVYGLKRGAGGSE